MSGSGPSAYQGVFFDLFGTLVTFDQERLPALVVDGRPVRTTLGALAPLVAEWLGDVSLEALLAALQTVTREMRGAHRSDHVEQPSRERFRRALVHLGCEGRRAVEAAVHLSREHMRQIARATCLPDAHREVLARVRARYGAVALVSNFDDTATAYEILHRHGIRASFDSVVVSEHVGLRKPHPALLRLALEETGVDAGAALFVGDTLDEDVEAAAAAGVDAAWIDHAGAGVGERPQRPRYVLRMLADVCAVLGLDER